MSIPQVMRQYRRAGIVLAAVALVAAILSLVLTAGEALEERRSAVAATDVRLAVLSVSPVADASVLDPVARELFDESLDLLAGDLDDAMHAVDEADRAEVSAEIEELVAHGRIVQSGMVHDTDDHSISAHHDLETIFRDASISAAAEASASERRAEFSAIISVLLFAVVVGALLRSRHRANSSAVKADAYRDAAARFGVLLNQSPAATALVASDGSVSYASTAMRELLGHTPTDASELAYLATSEGRVDLENHLLHGEGEAVALDVVSSLIDAEGQPREFAVIVSDLRDDPVAEGHLVTITETTADNQAKRDLEYLASHDQLTGLPNRRELMADLAAAEHHALLMIDLDGFKATNDTHGHGAGDQLLRSVTRRIESCLTPNDRLYRLGGDEFAILSRRTIGSAERLAMSVLQALEVPVELGTGHERTGASIGAAHQDVGSSPLSLLRRADIALYEAKHLGGHQLVVVSAELEDRSVSRSELARAFSAADLDKECHLEFQPIVDAVTGAPRCLEALARWTSPAHGRVSPDRFIPLAETSGRIEELGHWVLDHALQSLAAWRAEGLATDVGITVNVSPYQLERRGFVGRTKELLDRHGIEPSALTIELTESALATAIDSLVDQLEQLRELGCIIACDDFGSGYSNLGQLMAMPLSLIKIDRTLLLRLSEMREMAGDCSDQPCQVMRAIVSIGEAMQAQIVAEGIETALQASSVEAAGVQMLQGYLFSRPLPDDATRDYLAAVSADSVEATIAG